VSGVCDETIEMRGLRFHYRDWPGPHDGAQVIIALHGFTGHARSWDAFATDMSKTHRVIALDQRGHGESAWAPPDAYGTLEMVADLEAFVAALGLNAFSLVGLSMGGRVSIAYAGGRPKALKRLVIVDIAPEIEAKGLSTIRERAAAQDVFATKDLAFAAARANNSVPPVEHHRHRVMHSLMRTSSGEWTYLYDRVMRDPAHTRAGQSAAEGWACVAAINVPALLVRGEHSDILSPAVAGRFIDSAVDARLVEVAGSGHSVPLDKPNEFLAVTSTFLRESS
jgi:pimeloyl-ACP methyl ester carboxylesterase